jgi:hypothetical protein
MQTNIVTQLLRTLQYGKVTKSNLLQTVKSCKEYKQFSSKSWKVAIDEVWENSQPYFCKLYLENSSKDIIAVFFNLERERDNSLQCYAMVGEHHTAHPEYLSNKCKRINPDHPAAEYLVSYLRNGYAVNYHTESPIFV